MESGEWEVESGEWKVESGVTLLVPPYAGSLPTGQAGVPKGE